MEYINTLKWRTKTFLSTLPFFPFSCVNITVFGSCQVFYERILLLFFLTRYIPYQGSVKKPIENLT